MSANPTRVDWEATTADPGSPLQEGNRVLESIARQEALRALLAFSDLHEQIRNRRMATGCASDRDLFETERFILDEVLQLICDRVQAITQADGIVVALAESVRGGRRLGDRHERSAAERSQIVCRAAAGPLAIGRGVRLTGESEFLRDCLESGRILRCDDCETDDRFELDFARQIGARSTVLVPLRGRREQVGVLQAFSTTARAFTDHDVRCFDLFAELVLSALKPEDQDRRIHWLSDVAGEVLQAKPAAAVPVVADAAAVEIPEVAPNSIVETGLAPSPAAAIFSATEQARPAAPPIPEPVPELAVLAQPVVIPAALVELPERSVADEPFAVPFEIPSEILSEIVSEKEEPTISTQPPRVLPFLHRLSLPGSSRPGLSVVMGLVAVAALFSAGAWWGMQVHGKTAAAKVEAANTATSPQSVTTPPAPSGGCSISRNLRQSDESVEARFRCSATHRRGGKQVGGAAENHGCASLVFVHGKHSGH